MQNITVADMWKLGAALLVLCACIHTGQPAGRVEQGQERTINFDNFEDYLVSLGDRAHNEVLVKQESNSTTTTTAPPGQGANLDILAYFRDVPREHWSCCMLGKLAGDKGFHCHANFYRSRLVLRNFNRAHNRKMMFHGPTAMPHWGLEIMGTFRRCVSRMATQFHKCCYAATVERREMRRWQHYRVGTPTPATVTLEATTPTPRSPRDSGRRARRNRQGRRQRTSSWRQRQQAAAARSRLLQG